MFLKKLLKKIIFKQIRIGYRDKPFYIYKFKTMNSKGNISKFGRFLRTTGLDELPQIVNIFKKEIVLVGPRPLIPREHDKFRGFILLVKPGITGWWQIHGRKQDQIWMYDKEYLKIKSFWVDLYIILRTIPLVILRKHG